MRVLYDISALGLGQLYVQSRGGSYRADQHRVEGLINSGACEVLCCANHSSVAYEGCVSYLRANPQLGHPPLVGARERQTGSGLRRVMAAAHRGARAIAGGNVLPPWLRRSGTFVDRRLHQAVGDASPPVDIFQSATPLPPRVNGRLSPQRFLTFYDMSYTRFPEIYGPAYARAARAVLESLHGDDWVMTCSNASRSELCESGIVAPHRVFVSSLAADRRIFHPSADDDRVRAVRGVLGIPDGPYILSVNSVDPRKNIARAVRAFERAVQEGARDLTYVLIGHDGPGARCVVEHAEQSPALRARIRVTGFVADEHLAPLYRGAFAFVYPSIYEGFGLPPLEAMQCGTPVIASNASSLPEVVGEAGMLVDPDDEEALGDAMLKLYRDSALRERMRAQSLAQAARFSWDRSTGETLAAYRTALGR